MAGLRRRILGITVIAAGVCAALPFRYEAVNAPVDAREKIEHRAAATQNELALQLTIPTNPVAAPTTVAGQKPKSANAEARLTPQPQQVRRDELQTPPNFATAFEPLVATFPVATEASTTTKHADTPAQRHRIADGDTLESLALHYLGDRDRWHSIFAANNGLLTDRNILPIGQEIEIPQFRDPSCDDDDHLVPIPPGLLSREVR